MKSEKTIKYIGFYDSSQFALEKRNLSLAAVNKMNFIAASIVKAGYKVQFISPSWTANGKGYYRKRTSDISEGIILTVGPTFGAKNRIMRLFRMSWSSIWLFFYLLCNIKRGEKVIVYHSLMLILPIYCSKLIKGFKVILEIEEEYCVVIRQPIFFRRLERKIINISDYHILSTDLMNEAYRHLNIVNVVIYGNYNTQRITKNKRSDKVIVVYAGIIDSVKAGAFNAIRIAKYLDSRFELKIIGFGDNSDIEKLKQEIEFINKITDCKVKYDGLKNGDDYINYISQCHVGLSTQVSTGEYLKFSFPSKILSYMSVGLRVVSSKIECVEKSKIGEIVYYYEEDTPKSIAEAVKSIKFSDVYNSYNYLERLDKEFVQNIKYLLRS